MGYYSRCPTKINVQKRRKVKEISPVEQKQLHVPREYSWTSYYKGCVCFILTPDHEGI